MTESDERRLAEIRITHSGRTHYEGRKEPDDEFLLRMLDSARAKGRNAGLDESMKIIERDSQAPRRSTYGELIVAIRALRSEGTGK